MNALMERVEAWVRGEADLAPVTRLLGIRAVRWQEGTACVEMTADATHHNAMGKVHGGIFCDLADVAIGVAMASALEDGETFTSLELHVAYLRPAVAGVLSARALLVRRGRTTAYLECELLDDSGKLLAKATSICAIARADDGLHNSETKKGKADVR
jgi:uncharacterized protein (TIGR00369 family)